MAVKLHRGYGARRHATSGATRGIGAALLSIVTLWGAVATGVATHPTAAQAAPVSSGSDAGITLTYDVSPTALPSGGGRVTYSYTVTNNSGWVYHPSKIADTACANITQTSGGTSLLKGQSATYTCTTTLTQTTVSTATASFYYSFFGSHYTTASARQSVSVAAGGSSTPFSCAAPRVFIGAGTPTTQLSQQYQNPTSTDFLPIGKPGGQNGNWQYNALAYNTQDNYIYGVSTSGDSNNPAVNSPNGHLVRIDANGNVEDRGEIYSQFAFRSRGSISASSARTNWLNDIGGGGGGITSGTYDPSSNTYYVSTAARAVDPGTGKETWAGTTMVYAIDLSARTISQISNGTFRTNDFTVKDGYLWGMWNGDNTLVRMNLSTGAVTGFSLANLSAPDGATMPKTIYGAAWTYGNGNLGFDDNRGSGAYQIQVTNPTASQPTFALVAHQSAPNSYNNDGTNCVGTNNADLAIEKVADAKVTSGATVNFTLRVKNLGPGISSGGVVTDAIPANYTAVAVESAFKDVCSVNGNTVSCATGTLNPGDSYDIKLSAKAPSLGGTAGDVCLNNTASIAGNEKDPDSSNNSSSARTCVTNSRIDVEKTAGGVSGPDLTGHYVASYTVKVSNPGRSTATYSQLSDQPLFDPSVKVLDVAWSGGPSNAGQTSVQARDDGSYPIGTSSQKSLSAGAKHTYTVQVTLDRPTSAISACDGTPGHGLFNTVSLPEETESTSNNSACAAPPEPLHNTCSNVLFTSFSDQLSQSPSGSGRIGQVVSGTQVLSQPTGVLNIPRATSDGEPINQESSAMAVDPTNADIIYYTTRYTDIDYYGNRTGLYNRDLVRYNYSTGETGIVNRDSSAWQSNRLASAPDGTVWSFANDAHVYSWKPGGAVVDHGVPKAPDGSGIDFTGFRFGDIAFDGLGTMWILATQSTQSNPLNGNTYLLTISAPELGKTAPQSTMVGQVNGLNQGANFYGIAFGQDGTLYAASSTMDSSSGSNVIYTLSQADGSNTVKARYSGASYNWFGDLGSCAMPKPEMHDTKEVAKTTDANGVQTLNYTVTLANQGNLAATGVQFQDTLPDGITYVPGSAKLNGTRVPDGTNPRFPYAKYREAHGSTTKFPGVIPSQDKATLTFSATVNSDYKEPQVCNVGQTTYTNNDAGFVLTDDPSKPGEQDATCIDIRQSRIDVAKTAGTLSGPDANGIYTATYTVTVKNTGNGEGSYGPLTDTLGFDPNLTPVSASWSGQASGRSDFTQAPYAFALSGADTSIAAGATHTYAVSVALRYTGQAAAKACAGPGTGLFNQVSVGQGQESGPSDNNSACLPPPSLPKAGISVLKQGTNCDVDKPTCTLPGAQFALYAKKPGIGVKPIATVTTDASGKATFPAQPSGDYWLVETKAAVLPGGKTFELLPEPVALHLTAYPASSGGITLTPPTARSISVTGDDKLTVAVTDATPSHLPSTGGRGIWVWLVAGLALLGAAGAVHKFTGAKSARNRS